MLDEAVLDASVAMKVFLDEEGSVATRALVASGVRFVAPALVMVEIAHVLVKRMRRGEMGRSLASGILARAQTLFDELVRIESHASRAFVIAADHGLSAYDALYVALAEDRRWPLATADLRLVERVKASGLAIDFWMP